MGRLVGQFCAACDESFYRSPSGQSLLLFTLALVGGSPVVDPYIRLDPYLATVAHIQITLERLVHGYKMSESLLVVGLIRAIEDVLEDCSQQAPTLALAPGGIHDWSQATQRLIRQGLLVDSDGLAIVQEFGAPAVEKPRQARADLQMWRELTAPILEVENLERAIREEAEDED